MADTAEIKVNITVIKKRESKLATLAKKVENRQLSITLSKSEGDVAENLLAAVGELSDIGQSLAELITKTETVLENARESFNEADSTAAMQF